ncbi:MAG: SAM-dependent chlorinase/fluorinase [Chloroflexi bacterium]|nr:SAM-dependent chlorinase/fluorinase [Chloroflexota bacterium]MYE31347.1 SAM-dependent chlorinase/fluorinase [Chloroflexota bacterium]
MPGIVTLTTDFGTRDSYVAQLKGVLLSRCVDLRIHDLTHDIAPHDVVEGALFLAASVPTFPAGTVHLAVVDPGVGSERRPIAAEVSGQRVVCPDNSLLTLLARAQPIEAVHELTNPQFRREPVSATFEGRDVFAPAAAHLACGGAIADLGPAVSDLARLALPEPERTERGMRGEVMHVDRFGNAITNIHVSMLRDGLHHAQVRVAGRELPVLRTYADAAGGEALALVGSSGYIEVAVREGSAAETLGLRRGSPLLVVPLR